LKPNLKKAITEIAKTKLSPVATVECPNCGKYGKDTDSYKTPKSKIVNALISKMPGAGADMIKYVKPGNKPQICPDCADEAGDVISRGGGPPNPPNPK